MVYLVMLEALPLVKTNIVTQLRTTSNGFYPLGDGMYLMVTNSTAAMMRDWLRLLGATEIAVIPVQRGWATWGNDALANWLRGAGNLF